MYIPHLSLPKAGAIYKHENNCVYFADRGAETQDGYSYFAEGRHLTRLMLPSHLYILVSPFPTKGKTLDVFTPRLLFLSNLPGALSTCKMDRRVHMVKAVTPGQDPHV